MLYLYRSNSTAALADALCDVVGVPLSSPMANELVLVPSGGMEAWLRQHIAKRLGVCSGFAFPFPLKLIPELIIEGFAPDGASDDVVAKWRARLGRWEASSLKWPLWQVMRELNDDPRVAPMARYVEKGNDAVDRERRRMQLAERLAQSFDRYVRYRPEMVREWQGGLEDKSEPLAVWQAVLWRALVERLDAADGLTGEPQHLADVAPRYVADLTLMASRGRTPERLCVFGVSTLPPVYLQMLSALGATTDVHAFVVAPSRAYVADLMSARAKKRAEHRALKKDAGTDLSELHLSASPPLIAAFGQLGAEFQFLLESELDARREEQDLYVEPKGDHLLALLQRRLLDAVSGGAETEPYAASAMREALVDSARQSIEIHACFGALRQVQALFDRLHALLESDATLTPRDIVVMAPDLDTVAPLIDAVFAREYGDPLRIPYRVTDRSASQESPAAAALLCALSLLGGRFRRDEVLDLLALPPVRERFELSQRAVDDMRDALTRVGVTWGFDAAHRAACGRVHDETGSWQLALDRLLMGAIVPAEPTRMVGGLRPHSDSEGSAAARWGALNELLRLLADLDSEAAEEKTAKQWSERLLTFFEALVMLPADEASQLQRVRQTLTEFFNAWHDAAPDATLPLLVVREQLHTLLQETRSSHGFMRDGVTFCDMLPMRSVPFRVVALLGLDNGAFPRADVTGGIDVTENSPRRFGDRSRRSDDRYLVLEALLSARDRFCVFYQGFASDTGNARPPSPVVDELIEAIAYECGAAKAEVPVTQHALQPFSVATFERGTYAAEFEGAARALQAPNEEAPAWLAAPLPDQPARDVSIDELAAFASHPARAFHRRRFDLRLSEWRNDDAGRDPLKLKRLTLYRPARDYLSLRAEGASTEELQALLAGSGALPTGALGGLAERQVMALGGCVAGRVDVLRDGCEARRASLDAGGVVGVSGVIGEIYGRHRVVQRVKKRDDQSLTELWIRHLALCAAGEVDASSLVYVDDPNKASPHVQVSWFGAVDAPTAVAELTSWRQEYERALMGVTLWEPSVAIAYVLRLRKTEDEETALAAADSAWAKGSADADAQRYWPQGLTSDPERFKQTATRLAGPMLSALEVS